MISIKHITILLLISSSKMANDYSLIKIMDRLWFPNNVSKDLIFLVDEGYIEPFEKQNISQDYTLTTKAKTFFKKTNVIEILENEKIFEKYNFEKEVMQKLYSNIIEG